MKVSIGSDHGGVHIYEALVDFLTEMNHEVLNHGTQTTEAVDYPDFAKPVAEDVANGRADYGVLICKTGLGMSISANKVKGARAALIHNAEDAFFARAHNNANVICFGGLHEDAYKAKALLQLFLSTPFQGERHERRLSKIAAQEQDATCGTRLEVVDPSVYKTIEAEKQRQQSEIELIASENFTSPAVIEATGCLMTNKYAEGYPGKRYYGGCQNVDIVEQLAIDRALEIFGAEHANVQPHSGSQANTAVYLAFLKPGDKILTMSLEHGGHLTHGHPMNLSGKYYEVVNYGVGLEDGRIDYDALAETAVKEKPKMITVGASAYARIIDFARMGEIARSCGAYLLADIAHIAGLVAAGVHPSPVPHADFVTTTTHKTLRGPRGGLILCRSEHAKAINSAVFPGIQGGPLMHVIAAKAVCFGEALKPEFKAYQQQVVVNAKALAETLIGDNYHVVSGGTDNHLLLLDLRPTHPDLNGKQAQLALEKANITCNRNTVPNETRSPFQTSGLRLGTPAVTTRGMREPEMVKIAKAIHRVVSNPENETEIAAAREVALDLCRQFPLPY